MIVKNYELINHYLLNSSVLMLTLFCININASAEPVRIDANIVKDINFICAAKGAAETKFPWLKNKSYDAVYKKRGNYITISFSDKKTTNKTLGADPGSPVVNVTINKIDMSISSIYMVK